MSTDNSAAAAAAPGNDEIARVLRRAAKLLEQRDANPFRVRSYLVAADTIDSVGCSVAARLRAEGPQWLTGMPGIGDRLAGAIAEIVATGRLGLVDTLAAELTPVALLASVPGLGETLASRIHFSLGIDSLEELEMAAHDGRLAAVPGIGAGRLEGLRATLAGLLNRGAARRARRRARSGASERPPVSLILEIDEDYRTAAEAGRLRTIAPRRFNPDGKAWLPVMETERDGWHFTALYSNTARAHELGTTRDWVVLYYERLDDHDEGQCTVVTSGAGELAGRRIVAGRTAECRDFYA